MTGIEDVVDMMSESPRTLFTTLDARSGYHSISIRPQDRELTTFVVPSGSYCFNRLPFGVSTAVQTYSLLLSIILRKLSFRSCISYLDDIIIMSNGVEKHLQDVQEVFNRIRGSSLKLHPKKCSFFQDKVRFLGYEISAQGLHTDPEKLKIIRDWKPPTDLKSLRACLGYFNFYRRFVPNYSIYVAPLTHLLCNNVKWEWTPECQTAFITLRDATLNAPPLGVPDFKREFYLSTDASSCSISWILEQKDDSGNFRNLGAGGRGLFPREQRFSTIEREALSLQI